MRKSDSTQFCLNSFSPFNVYCEQSVFVQLAIWYQRRWRIKKKNHNNSALRKDIESVAVWASWYVTTFRRVG